MSSLGSFGLIFSTLLRNASSFDESQGFPLTLPSGVCFPEIELQCLVSSIDLKLLLDLGACQRHGVSGHFLMLVGHAQSFSLSSNL